MCSSIHNARDTTNNNKNELCLTEEANNKSSNVIVMTIALSYMSYQFSIFITRISLCYTNLFTLAYFSYDEELTRFDTTIYTYGTDYVLFLIMCVCAYHVHTLILQDKNEIHEKPIIRPTVQLLYNLKYLLMCYATSVLCGGLAHQNFHNVESMNTVSFRVIWTLCVGTVTLAGGFIGAMGSDIYSILLTRHQRNENKNIFVQFRIAHWTWYFYGIVLTIILSLGYMSLKRPACDILIAGTTQTFPTIYFTWQVYRYYCSINHSNIAKDDFFTLLTFVLLAFFLNAPLMPFYPIMCNILQWPLYVMNTILHSWLTITWTSQFFVVKDMYQFIIQKCSERKEAFRDKKLN